MNTLFKSLANIWANRRQVEDRLGTVYVFTEEALQVYAEQIVKECVQVAEESDLGLDIVSTRIKEHFGVKNG
jgi:hypothetical protein